MSQKWIRSKKWDDEHFPSWAWPAKALLRAFSSIPLAVVLLTCVAMYGTLASVPIGLIALAPTYLIYALTVLLAVGLIAILPVRSLAGVMRRSGASRAVRFGVSFFAVILLTLAALWLWRRLAWPVLRYDEVTHGGFRLFADFVAHNKAVTVRRLPGMEMSELEFYAWWPLKVILVAFVLNMITTTVRRIEFAFPNIGVLTVHSGIVVLALGSMYYSSLKQEGDMLLVSGAATSDGSPTPGPPESGFYDNTRVALWANDGTGWRQLPLQGVPRYHDYNLNALGVTDLAEWARQFDEGRTLDIPVNLTQRTARGYEPALPPSLDGVTFDLVGYAPYASVSQQWVPASPAEVAALTTQPIPVRNFEILMETPRSTTAKVSDRSQLFPTIPAGRMQQIGLGMMLEYTSGMSATRWADLNTPTSQGSPHSLIVEVPSKTGGAPTRVVLAISEGSAHAIGDTGYTIETVRIMPSLLELLSKSEGLPVGIDDPMYAGADTSVAVIKINPPASSASGLAGAEAPYLRFVYHRYPEQSIDIIQTVRDPAAANGGSPLGKRAASDSIRLSYLDDSVPQYYIDESVSESTDAGNPVLRGVFRPRAGGSDGKPLAITGLKPGATIQLGPVASLRIAERWAHATPVEYPLPVPAMQRDNKELGTHRNAALAVQVQRDGWTKTVWLPFSQYILTEEQNARTVTLPDGKRVLLAFGRCLRALPGLHVQLADFHMYSYDFGGPSQDFRSDLIVTHDGTDKQNIELRYTSLNDPLLVRVPFQAREDLSAFGNLIGRVVNVIAPTQYKFSQAGWDPDGWNTTQAEVDRGERKRPLARWTILGVGNNPGIYVIAAGAIMMVLGIPWAFYIKPLIVRSRKKKIQAQLAANTASKAPKAELVEVNT